MIKKRDLQIELKEAKQCLADITWMARRYADGRKTYATSMYNDVANWCLKHGVNINPGAEGIVWARDGHGRGCDGLSDKEAIEGTQEGLGIHKGNKHPHALNFKMNILEKS